VTPEDLCRPSERKPGMRKLAIVMAAGLVAVGGADGNVASSSRQSRVRGPFLLVSLASLGTVTWRCDPARQPSLALGFRAFSSSADAYARLVVGSRTIKKAHVVPGAQVNFPYVRASVQKLNVVQGTEAGTLRAFVAVDFAAPSVPSHCWPYAPPRTHVTLTTRH
jgi:hypothetical protein